MITELKMTNQYSLSKKSVLRSVDEVILWLDHEWVCELILILLKNLHCASSVVQWIWLADVDVHCVYIIREFDSLRVCVSFSLHEISFSHYSNLNVCNSVCLSSDISMKKLCAVIVTHLNCISCAHILHLKS